MINEPDEGFINDKQQAWHECWNCEDGYSHHDCGEDCCCCADPEPNVVCDICQGEGGWYEDI